MGSGGSAHARVYLDFSAVPVDADDLTQRSMTLETPQFTDGC